jgi:transcriptional regulator with XRE-family HTH domain
MEIDLRKLRNAKSLKQSELADILGVKQPYISSIESGRIHISDDVYQRLKYKFPDFEQFIFKNGDSDTYCIPETEANKLMELIMQQLERMKEKDEQISRLLKIVEDCQKKLSEK